MALSDAPLLRALAGDRPDHAPVWFMRQAGRSLPEYRELRVGTRMLDVCLTPDMAAEITLQPVRRHGVDAAIFFSDIVVPLKLAGVEVEIQPGRGPVFADPVRTAADVDRITAIDPDSLVTDQIAEAVRLVTEELDGRTPLIGFAGAPFTLAAYLVEGGPSKEHMRARAMMHTDPDAWHRLAGWLAQVSRRFLIAQRDAFTIERLRAGGAICLGLTNMPPMANGGMQRGVYGRAESPYSADWLTSAFGSGSSNGSGTATAASFASLGAAADARGRT